MRKVMGSLLFGSFLLTAGCQDSPEKLVEQMSNEICECKDVKCAEGVAKKYEEKAKKFKDDKSLADNPKVKAAGEKMAGCMMKLAMSEMGTKKE
jgi:hypothetical protein